MQQPWNANLYNTNHSFVYRYGEDLLNLLAPAPGQRILDLGCGTAELTQKIANAGATVTGIDPSDTMLAGARKNFPDLDLRCIAAEDMDFDNEFDAVFSNAVLHWIPDQDTVVRNVARALKPRGRFVFEMGARNCNQRIFSELRRHIIAAGYTPVDVFHFRSVAEFAVLLECHGFRIDFATEFDRDTLLDGDHGMEHFLRMFPIHMMRDIPSPAQDPIIAATVAALRHTPANQNGIWHADYTRLRMHATKM